MFSYHLSNIPGFNDLVKTGEINSLYNKYYSVNNYSTKSNHTYSIVSYNKELLSCDLIPTYGLLRSVILSGSQIVSFSPPKSISADNFITKYPTINDSIIAQEFIEGTMINVFFDTQHQFWQISTRNTVGAEVSFYKSSKTFNLMFMETCTFNNLDIQILNPNYSYSFILQHPENRIVVPFKLPQLFLVSVYEIIQKEDNVSVKEIDINLVKNAGLWDYTSIKFPQTYEFTSYSELISKFASPNTPYDILGIVVKNKDTGERTKFRNPIYEEVRHLKGNQPKLQYQYLCLRHSGKIADYLKYYPEARADMSQFRDHVHMFTNTLHQNYISCYVKKEKSLKEYPNQYKTHMFKLHEYFINELRPKHLFVTNTVVINYVNKLHPSLLMYCLNHHMRKRFIDTIKSNSVI